MTPTSPFSPLDSGAPSALCLLCGAANPPSATSCQTCGSPLAPAAPARSESYAGADDLAGDLSGFARALPAHTSLRNGDYRVLGVLGQGGFGITYRALNQRLEREVAIKEFFPATCERVGRSVSASGGLSAPDFDSLRAAFLEEARILARFELPAVVRVMGAWEENASAYMEMEILRGPTMAQVLEERERLPVEATVRLFEPVIDALEAIHSAGWLHRDIKPHNIIFEPNAAASGPIDPSKIDLGACRAVLLDFGAAKKVAANVSQSFSVIVTPGYAPLEQYATRARRGAFTDVYALCATLYHALTGQVPPSASDRALHDDLIPVRELRPEVPQIVARAIEEGLRTAIAARPQTMAELREVLRGRGAFQTAAQAASDVRESRDPKVGQLKARQQSILSNIQSINQPGNPRPNPQPIPQPRPNAQPKREMSEQERLIDSLPVSQEAMQMLTSASETADSKYPPAQPSAPTSMAKPDGAPLPTARPTYGGSHSGGGHLHEGLSERGTWSNKAYLAAIGAGLVLLAAGSFLFFSSSPTPPDNPPPIEEPQSFSSHAARAQIENVHLSPDGRHKFGTTSDGHGRVWDTASGRRVLDIGFLDPQRLHDPRWSPDGKYLLLVQCAPDRLAEARRSLQAQWREVARLELDHCLPLRRADGTRLNRFVYADLRRILAAQEQQLDALPTIIGHDARLFRMATPALVWRRSLSGAVGEQAPEWDLGRSVALRVDGQARRFPLE